MEKLTNELEEMRQQLNMLKSKLANEKIVNDRMIRQLMLNKMSFFKNYERFAYAALIVVFLCFLFLTLIFKMSWWLFAFTMVIVVIDVLVDKWINRFSTDEFITGNLVETAHHMMWQRKFRKLSTVIGSVVMLGIWLPWFGFELYNKGIFMSVQEELGMDNTPFHFGFIGIASGLLGAIIGTVVAITIYFRMQRINKEVIEQIKELKEG